MRHELWPWNEIKLVFELVDLDGGRTALSPVGIMQRSSDGNYLQGDGSWGASPANLSLSAVSGHDGRYEYAVPATSTSPSHGVYRVRITESTELIVEHVTIIPLTDGGKAVDPDTVVAGSMADLLLQATGLMGRHHRVTYATFTGSGNNLPATGTMKIYESAVDASADTNVKATYNFTASYDGQDRLTSYLSTKA